MIAAILQHFPARTHPLTLVSDPDGLLADEDVLAALAERGFTLVNEPDPVALRSRVESLRPWSVDRPLIVVTAGDLNALPYDLWQQGHPVTLALHTFFPNLAYPLVRVLTLAQRWRLSQSPPPPRRLGQQGTIEFLLHHVFAADLDALRQPARLVAWLDDYHHQAGQMPAVLADDLLGRLRAVPAYADWPLDDLLASQDTFVAFVREQWCAYMQQQTGELIKEAPARYLLDFAADYALQDALPGLVRSGALEPLGVERPDRLPNWARPAVLAVDEDLRPRRAAELLSALAEHLDVASENSRWEQWQAIARAWAELTALRYAPDAPLAATQQEAYQSLQGRVDAAFAAWLRGRYAPLGGQRLPTPHHVHHAPHYIAYRRRQDADGIHPGVERVALLVLDGLALADWTVVGPAWRARHPDWRLDEHLLLAQIPTITAVSRQALVGGLRPADFAATLNNAQAESKHWAAFWAREGLPPEACPCVHLALEREGAPPEIGSACSRALCLIDHKLDEMAHDATLGATGFYAALRVWQDGYGRQVEELIAELLAREYVVYLASDHGHVEARGFGQPAEGVTVDTRGQRARIYSDQRAAARVQQAFLETILWNEDGLLPDSVWVLMPDRRGAFCTFNEITVTHGGLTLDEVVVPLVAITRRDQD